MTTEMGCDDCHHARHEPGQCKRCNCGESGITALTGSRNLAIVSPDRGPEGSSLGLRGIDRGHRVKPKRAGEEN